MIVRYEKFDTYKGRIRVMYCLLGIVPLFISYHY